MHAAVLDDDEDDETVADDGQEGDGAVEEGEEADEARGHVVLLHGAQVAAGEGAGDVVVPRATHVGGAVDVDDR